LICLRRTVESCIAYYVHRSRERHSLELQRRRRTCLCIYHYWIDPRWAFISARIQTWFPFDIYVCLNGRQWLAREMDRLRMSYRRGENCFLWIEDPRRAQPLMDKQPVTRWLSPLRQLSRRLNPVHAQIFHGLPIQYY
jgi:hypothetical protein